MLTASATFAGCGAKETTPIEKNSVKTSSETKTGQESLVKTGDRLVWTTAQGMVHNFIIHPSNQKKHAVEIGGDLVANYHPDKKAWFIGRAGAHLGGFYGIDPVESPKKAAMQKVVKPKENKNNPLIEINSKNKVAKPINKMNKNKLKRVVKKIIEKHGPKALPLELVNNFGIDLKNQKTWTEKNIKELLKHFNMEKEIEVNGKTKKKPINNLQQENQLIETNSKTKKKPMEAKLTKAEIEIRNKKYNDLVAEIYERNKGKQVRMPESLMNTFGLYIKKPETWTDENFEKARKHKFETYTIESEVAQTANRDYNSATTIEEEVVQLERKKEALKKLTPKERELAENALRKNAMIKEQLIKKFGDKEITKKEGYAFTKDLIHKSPDEYYYKKTIEETNAYGKFLRALRAPRYYSSQKPAYKIIERKSGPIIIYSTLEKAQQTQQEYAYLDSDYFFTIQATSLKDIDGEWEDKRHLLLSKVRANQITLQEWIDKQHKLLVGYQKAKEAAIKASKKEVETKVDIVPELAVMQRAPFVDDGDTTQLFNVEEDKAPDQPEWMRLNYLNKQSWIDDQDSQKHLKNAKLAGGVSEEYIKNVELIKQDEAEAEKPTKQLTMNEKLEIEKLLKQIANFEDMLSWGPNQWVERRIAILEARLEELQG